MSMHTMAVALDYVLAQASLTTNGRLQRYNLSLVTAEK